MRSPSLAPALPQKARGNRLSLAAPQDPAGITESLREDLRAAQNQGLARETCVSQAGEKKWQWSIFPPCLSLSSDS